MRETASRQFRTPLSVAIAVTAVGMLVFAVIDYLTGKSINVANLYSVVLLMCATAQNRTLLWSVALVAVALTYGVFFATPDVLSGGAYTARIINRTFTASGLILATAVLHAMIGILRALDVSRQTLTRRSEDLEAANAELAAREEEISTQNEELQSQTEELERQSEELRVANEELARRERTLESLLRLSRSLTAEMSPAQTLQRICQGFAEIVEDADLGIAVKMLEGRELRLICQQGFGAQGPNTTTFPFERSFARLVLERNRVGYLEDMQLRPDLLTPQPKEGAPFRSILAAPLRVNGHAVGTLEIYSRTRQSWTEAQIGMIESLAAQTSVSLQAAELFERIDQERRRLQAVLNTVSFGVMIANADLSDIRVNPGGATIRGVPPDVNLVPLGGVGRWKLFENGVELPEPQHPLVRAVRDGDIIDKQEYDMLAEGRRYTILLSASPIRDRAGKIVGGVAASVDITEQKRLQFELDARRREAEESSARKTRFLAAVSHDIRTPANAIGLLCELLHHAADNPAMAHEIPQIVTDLRSSSQMLVNLVSAVLDLTRYDAGRIDLDESEFPLEQIIQDECRQLQPIARERDLSFECECPPSSIIIRADRVKLSRILVNLISNAIKFTSSGGVSVSAGTSDEQGVWIRVSDTGVGIPREYQQRIFDEFFQLQSGDGKRKDGSGLGLAICSRLAQAMGGSISVHSEPGTGSTFTVSLPASCIVATASVVSV